MTVSGVFSCGRPQAARVGLEALPLASGMVRRVVERGDVFLAVQGSVCVANASWTSVPNEVRSFPLAHSIPPGRESPSGMSDPIAAARRLLKSREQHGRRTRATQV